MLHHNNSVTARILIAGLTFFAFGCAQTKSPSQIPETRAKVVENLDPIVKMEQRGAELTMVVQKLPHVARITTDDVQRLKEHFNVYYVFHDAATISLAQGNIQAYRDQINVASAELDSLEAKLRDIVEKSSEKPY